MHNQEFYKNLTEKELAVDEYFRQWVLRPDRSSDQFWNVFAALSPDCRNTVLYARRLVETSTYAAYDLTPLDSIEKHTLKTQIFDRLNLPVSQDVPEIAAAPRHIFMARRMAAAAAFIGFVAAGWLLYTQQLGAGRKKQNTLLAEQTGPNEVKKILLSDSTVVILNANSILRYNPDFSITHQREVSLEGNAFFQVRKEAGQSPFIVKVNSLSVTVLGTEFNVNARSASPEVALTTGKIKLTTPGKVDSPVYLLPGDKVRLDTNTHTFSKSIMDTRLYSAWTDGIWNFRQNTLEEITSLLSEYYGVSVVFQSQHSKHMRIDAVIEIGSLQKLVPVLASTIHTKMSLIENKLIIQ